VGNDASVRVLEKLGFCEEGTLRDYICLGEASTAAGFSACLRPTRGDRDSPGFTGMKDTHSDPPTTMIRLANLLCANPAVGAWVTG